MINKLKYKTGDCLLGIHIRENYKVLYYIIGVSDNFYNYDVTFLNSKRTAENLNFNIKNFENEKDIPKFKINPKLAKILYGQ